MDRERMELAYLVELVDAETDPTVEKLRKAVRLRTQNKTSGWGYSEGKMGSTLDSLVAAARNTAEWKIYDAAEGVDL